MNVKPPTPDHGELSAGIAPERLDATISLLDSIAADRSVLDSLPEAQRERLHQAIARVYHPDPKAGRRKQKARMREQHAEKLARSEALLNQTGIRTLRRSPVYSTPNYFPPHGPGQHDALEHSPEQTLGESPELMHCYTCKVKYRQVHHFYDQLCPQCAELNFRKRGESCDLSGRVALLTGGRVKIGYQAGLKLLRAGAELIVTTRFPRDSAARYAAEADFSDWQDRLEIYGLDLRHTPSVESFCSHLMATRRRLDFIINNACQTVRRPPEFYRHMMEMETTPLSDLPQSSQHLLGEFRADMEQARSTNLDAASQGLSTHQSEQQSRRSAELSQLPLLQEDLLDQGHLFPLDRLDQDMQQVDLRGRNSWRLQMDEVPAVELLETQLVNAVAPFILNARLKSLMLRTPERDKHIVNVSAMEGQFYRNFKTTRHPHTNMAKAALNMMTRTSAADYHGDGIHMNSVDTGWVTDEDPEEIAARKIREERFHPPLDILDGAARIVDPIIDGFITGKHVWGQFLKDYRSTDW